MTNTETATQARSGTAGYRLVVPGGWFGVDLDPGRPERAVAALVERQFAGTDNAPHLKAQARQELLALARAAYAAGGLEMFLSAQQVAGIPLAASLAIFLIPQPGSRAVTAGEEVFVPVPRDGSWLLLAFSAPAGPLALAMTKLFDAIAATLRWDQ